MMDAVLSKQRAAFLALPQEDLMRQLDGVGPVKRFAQFRPLFMIT